MNIQLVSVTALIIIAVASSAWAGGGCCGAAKPMANATASVAAGKAQTMCPVLDEPITSKDVYVDHNGQRIYLCCAGCKATFSKDPEKYIKKLEAEGVQIEKAPAQE
jgi:YHS domain-containing protein